MRLSVAMATQHSRVYRSIASQGVSSKLVLDAENDPNERSDLFIGLIQNNSRKRTCGKPHLASPSLGFVRPLLSGGFPKEPKSFDRKDLTDLLAIRRVYYVNNLVATICHKYGWREWRINEVSRGSSGCGVGLEAYTANLSDAS